MCGVLGGGGGGGGGVGAQAIAALEAFQRREGISNLTEALRIALWRFLLAEGLANPAAKPSGARRGK